MLKIFNIIKSKFLILFLACCLGQEIRPNTQETIAQHDSNKAKCPPALENSRCLFKCDNRSNRSTLACTDTGLDRLSGSEVVQWSNSLKRCNMELFSLQLDYNSIGRLTQMPDIPGLVILDLKKNAMTEIEPKAFLYLTKLKELDLSNNLLTGEAVRPDIFIGPSNKEQYEPLSIEVIHLSQNNIHSLDSKTFEHLPNLRELYLHDNRLLKVMDEHTCTAITSAQQLMVLTLSGCMLRKISLPRDSTLRMLFLNNNNISNIPQELPANLTYLNLNGNPIPEIQSCAFSHLSNLEELTISGMPNLTTLGPRAFQGLLSLKTLHCDFNMQLKDIHPAAFVEMAQNWTLREVSFNRCMLKNLHRSLLPWKQIVTLDLRDNPLSCDADDWSPDAIKLIQRSEKTFGLLEEQERCDWWHLEASRHPIALSTASRILLVAASVVAAVAFAAALVVLSVRRAQAERCRSHHLMVHYRRAIITSNNF